MMYNNIAVLSQGSIIITYYCQLRKGGEKWGSKLSDSRHKLTIWCITYTSIIGCNALWMDHPIFAIIFPSTAVVALLRVVYVFMLHAAI